MPTIAAPFVLTQLPPGASCVGEAQSVFFSDEIHDIASAKRICAECPAMADCLEGAIERHEPWGVWGGQLFRNGKALRTKRPRGRPPAQPRPEHLMPDIPVPDHLRSRLRIA